MFARDFWRACISRGRLRASSGSGVVSAPRGGRGMYKGLVRLRQRLGFYVRSNVFHRSERGVVVQIQVPRGDKSLVSRGCVGFRLVASREQAVAVVDSLAVRPVVRPRGASVVPVSVVPARDCRKLGRPRPSSRVLEGDWNFARCPLAGLARPLLRMPPQRPPVAGGVKLLLLVSLVLCRRGGHRVIVSSTRPLSRACGRQRSCRGRLRSCLHGRRLHRLVLSANYNHVRLRRRTRRRDVPPGERARRLRRPTAQPRRLERFLRQRAQVKAFRPLLQDDARGTVARREGRTFALRAVCAIRRRGMWLVGRRSRGVVLRQLQLHHWQHLVLAVSDRSDLCNDACVVWTAGNVFRLGHRISLVSWGSRRTTYCGRPACRRSEVSGRGDRHAVGRATFLFSLGKWHQIDFRRRVSPWRLGRLQWCGGLAAGRRRSACCRWARSWRKRACATCRFLLQPERGSGDGGHLERRWTPPKAELLLQAPEVGEGLRAPADPRQHPTKRVLDALCVCRMAPGDGRRAVQRRGASGERRCRRKAATTHKTHPKSDDPPSTASTVDAVCVDERRIKSWHHS